MRCLEKGVKAKRNKEVGYEKPDSNDDLFFNRTGVVFLSADQQPDGTPYTGKDGSDISEGNGAVGRCGTYFKKCAGVQPYAESNAGSGSGRYRSKSAE